MSSAQVLSLSDVHRALLERISAGVYPVGARLPSCRALAVDLGSNASTVDRALQRLADADLVRTLPRRGSFVVATPRGRELTGEALTQEFERLVGRARRAGLAPAEIRARVSQALDAAEVIPRVALIECNPPDLERLRSLVESTTGVRVEPVLIQDVAGRRLDREFDVVATPLFHLHELAGSVDELDAVVDINVVVAAPVLRRIATIEHGQRIAVATSTARGVHRLVSLVRQYFSGEVVEYQVGVDPLDKLAGVDVLVRTNAGPITKTELAAVREVVQIEWALEPGFGASFRARLNQRLDRVAAGRQPAASTSASSPDAIAR